MNTQIARGLKLTNVLRKYHPDFPPNGLAIFLMIAKEEGITAGAIADELGIAKATVSRNLRMLSDRLAPNKDGLHMIDQIPTKEDSRVRSLHLTEIGYTFLAELDEALS